jgi:hypothetical protein
MNASVTKHFKVTITKALALIRARLARDGASTTVEPAVGLLHDAAPTAHAVDHSPPRARIVTIDGLVYALCAAAATLWVACLFYSSMRTQTALTADPASGTFAGEWSAPLDDVFIHFDFARATARGFPFHWSETNGYSSGGTSLLYPLVLALGYRIGFTGTALMIWAGIIATSAVFGWLLVARRSFRELPRWTGYLAIPILLGLGALSWTLFSGMEVALLLALWSLAFVFWDELSVSEARSLAANVLLGLLGAALVATRPEAITALGAFVLCAAVPVLRRRGRRAAVELVLIACLPALSVLVTHALANYWLTGDSTAAGALVKLEIHHPHLSAEQKWDAWKFHVVYQIMRVTHYHMSLIPGFGWIMWALAAYAAFDLRTRRYAVLLWLSAAAWVLLIALNGQVRWQNERYTMPAVAWLLLAAALGVGAVLSGVPRLASRPSWAARGVCVIGLGLYVWQQVPRFREQVWFFGRASRNIRDQHTRAGRYLATVLKPHRILLGDAGAISYAADLPALDIIGLGGYRGLPFARATRLGVEAALELIERMPPEQRPDVMAIYPSWWGVMPIWFGRYITEFPVTGNVICGGPSKVIYGTDWSPFEGSSRPMTGDPRRVVRDRVDMADLVSEAQHDYEVDGGGAGSVQMKLLDDPYRLGKSLWDAGRSVPAGAGERFRLSGLSGGREARLIFRAAPAHTARFEVVVGEHSIGTVSLPESDSWQEVVLSIPADRVAPELAVRLGPSAVERALYHVWVVQEL